MKIRRTLSIAAVTAALTAVLTAAPASADTIGEFIDNFDCRLLEVGLTQSRLVDENTTRNQLAAELRGMTNFREIHPGLALVGNAYAGAVADRALQCEIVKKDPEQDIIKQLTQLSSNLSS